MNILLENEGEHTIFCEHFSISEGISRDHSDRILISIEGIKSEFQRVFADVFLGEGEYLPGDYGNIDSSSEKIRITFFHE